MATTVKTRSFTLSDEAMTKLDETAMTTGFTRSAVLERVIMGLSAKSILRYSRMAPTYAEETANDSNNTIQPTSEGGRAEG